MDRLAPLQAVAPVTRISERRRFLNGPIANPRLLLVELIKLDLAAAAAAGLDRRLSDIRAEFSKAIWDNQRPVASPSSGLWT
jgi:hypothetical protein